MNNNNRDYQMEDDFWFGDKKTRLPQIWWCIDLIMLSEY